MGLNFPQDIQLLTKKEKGKQWVFDKIRKKYVVLTPEEEVRQLLLHFLVQYRSYPAGLIAVERKIVIDHLSRRPDIVVHSKTGKPWMIIECKAPDEPLNTSVVEQIAQYNRALQPKYLTISNGKQHIVIELKGTGGFAYLQDFPEY